MCRQQDDDLDHLGEHVIRIGQMGRQIGEELGQQSTLIDELDGDIDGTANRLTAAQKKMTHVLKKSWAEGATLHHPGADCVASCLAACCILVSGKSSVMPLLYRLQL